jgi:hypothetical protein
VKTVQFEYGQGHMVAQLPDTAEVFVPGETVPDPPYLEDVETATRESIEHPVGMPPIAELVGPGARVTLSFPDRVKGGFQENSHRKTCIPLLIDECLKAGVRREDIKLICAIGLHRKNTDAELRRILGEKVYNEFMPTHQIVNHDSEDWDNLIDLGYDELGSRVIMNKEVFESDLPILIGHVLGNPYGGYSGGYKMAATGITHWKCIGAHHVPEVMHRDDFVPASVHSEMRKRMDAIGVHMESQMGRRFFMCDAVLDTRQRQIAVFSGYAKEMQPLAWSVADRRTFVPWAGDKFDIMMFGMPQYFHYGNGHGTNPILMLQAIAANVIRHQRVMRDNPVVICSSICNGYFHDEEFPSYRELFELFQGDYHNTLTDLGKYADYFCSKQEYTDKYRYNFGYHAFHPFSMISCGHIAEMYCAAVYIVGAYEPGYARAMGMKTRATFEEALKDAERYVGENPKILALPKAFRTAAVHLEMKDDDRPQV